MQVINKINHLITELTKLKPTLSDDSSNNEKKFNELLTTALQDNYTVADEETKITSSSSAKFVGIIPSWVDPDYPYNPENPRKPNMRELMEALSGKDVENLYAEINQNSQRISRVASDILYGVIGTNEDTRDWQSIMASDDILSFAREQTGAMYRPEVDIQSNFDENDILIKQIAVIKDDRGNTLRALSSNTAATEETLLNFGVTKASIPTNLEAKIDSEKFDNNLLTFLKNFDNQPNSIQKIVTQSASEVIASKLANEIPLDELAKL